MKFSIIVVCLNAGEKLNQTLDSVLAQTCGDYEIIVKDGGSSDGSVEGMRLNERIRFFSEPDRGIYDAMNQAVSYARGEYVLFLNCGDVLYDEKTLERAAERIERETGRIESAAEQVGRAAERIERETGRIESAAEQTERQESGGTADDAAERMVFYGDTYGSRNGVLITAQPAIDGFACYRNIPCHQSCFYAVRLVREKPYELKYRIRADYDHFLWCFYVAKAKMAYMDMTVAAYEGGGYSESPENKKRDKAEHREITQKYMSGGELFRYRALMALSLAPLRRFLAESPVFAGAYHKLKKLVYSRGK